MLKHQQLEGIYFTLSVLPVLTFHSCGSSMRCVMSATRLRMTTTTFATFCYCTVSHVADDSYVSAMLKGWDLVIYCPMDVSDKQRLCKSQPPLAV